MSAIDDLIAQVQEPRLREQLKREWAEAQKTKKFGLVFDRHLPELVPIPKARPRRGDLVARKGGSLTDLWRVRRVSGGVAHCVRPEGTPGAGDPWDLELDELVVVRRFGEPIFPALTPMAQVQNGPAHTPWHCLIEADNFHALQLLGYLYAGKVDCIYIDPPYNTGARDWKYNNDYVDANDTWRHSKWLSFMERRLRLAKRLLRPENGVLIVTVDENEVHHLGMLLRQIFPQQKKQMVTIVIQAAGSNRKGELGRVEEYAFFVFLGNAVPHQSTDDLLNDAPSTKPGKVRWESLLRSGTHSRREERPGLFFPVFVSETGAIVGCGDTKPRNALRDEWHVPAGATAVWPFKTNGSEGCWRCSPARLRNLVAEGFAKAGKVEEAGKGTVWYLGDAARRKIASGEFEVIGTDSQGAKVVAVKSASDKTYPIKTVWSRPRHHAGWYGTNLVATILPDRSFPFPKSLYSVQDTLRVVVGDRPDALILDFFAGSGTTLNAVNLLNASDGGRRKCILVTNNEVSADEAEGLRVRGLQSGDDEWEGLGICRSVTWPRSKFTIRGRRDDGTVLPGEYLAGKTVERERPRRVAHIGFVESGALDRPAKKKQLLALIEGLPQTLVTDPCPFIVSEDHKASVLFDEGVAEDWLAALDGQSHITDLYIVTPNKKRFDALKAEVQGLLGPILVSDEEKRPLSEGFPANLAYFKLEFLDKDRVALKRAFREILPLLWLKAGAIGPRPELAPKRDQGEAEPIFFAPPANPFAVLLDEGSLKALLGALADRSGLRCLFIVTDSEDAFKELSAEAMAALRAGSPSIETVQLYRDYLENFLINTDRSGGDGPTSANKAGAR